MVEHFGCEMLLFWLVFRVVTHFRFHPISVFACDEGISFTSLKGLGPAIVKVRLIGLVLHPPVVDIILVFNTVPRVLSNIVTILFWLAIDNVVGRWLLVIDSNLIHVQTSSSVVWQFRVLWARNALGLVDCVWSLNCRFMTFNSWPIFRVDRGRGWLYSSNSMGIGISDIASVRLFDWVGLSMAAIMEKSHRILNIWRFAG